MTYTDVIIDFDSSLIGSSLEAKYILFEQCGTGYNHLCIAQDSKANYYAESFFYNPRDIYLNGQTHVLIKKTRIYDREGNLYLEDSFETD